MPALDWGIAGDVGGGEIELREGRVERVEELQQGMMA